MTLFLLPACHFVLAVLTLGCRRWGRGLLALGTAVDLTLVGVLLIGAKGGVWPSVVLGGWTRALGIELSLDLVAAAFLALAVVLEIAVLAYLWRGTHRPVLYALLHLLFASIFSLLFSRDLFNLYVILELLTLISFLLVGYDRRPAQIWASLKYLVLTSFGMSLFLLGIAVVYRHTGTLNLVHLRALLLASPPAAWQALAGSLLVAGVAVKAGLITSSLWLPSAHTEAPAAISALLSGLVIKMGVVVLIRLRALFDIGLVLQVLGSTTCLVGVLYAAFARDVKRMLALHTLSQIGYILLGVAAGTPAGTFAALAYAVAHGLFKGLLFLAAGDATASVGSRRIARLVSERDRIPHASRLALLVGTLGIVGLPPLAGSTAKSLLFAAELPFPVELIMVVTSVGTALSFAKLIPLFSFSGRYRPANGVAVAYAPLAALVLCFAPALRLAMPSITWAVVLDWRIALEGLAAVGLGFLLYRLTKSHPLTLPNRIFRLEEGLLAVLLGFFVIYALTRFA